MVSNLQSWLLLTVFASQIIVVSYYVPLRWRRYYARMFERYTPEQYPRLYPVPKQEIERKQATFRSVSLAVAVGAAVIGVGALIHGESPRLIATVMIVCLLVQAILMMCIPLRLEAMIKRAFRAMSPPSVRSAELRRWRVTDFVSPLWIGLGLGLQTVGLACAALVWLYRPQTLALIPTSVGGGALFLLMIYALARRGGLARTDPYMSPEDTFVSRQARLRSLFRAGACLGAYQTFTLLYNTQLIRFDVVYLFMGLSVISQLWWLSLVIRSTPDLGKRDLSVYRVDGGAQVAPVK